VEGWQTTCSGTGASSKAFARCPEPRTAPKEERRRLLEARARSFAKRPRPSFEQAPLSYESSRPRILGRDLSASARDRPARGRAPATNERDRRPRDVTKRHSEPSEPSEITCAPRWARVERRYGPASRTFPPNIF